MIIAAVEGLNFGGSNFGGSNFGGLDFNSPDFSGPDFSLDRLLAAAETRGVRTRMLTRDADVRAGQEDSAPGEDLVVTLVNNADLVPTRDPDSWARSALTAAIGLALDHRSPRARTLTRNRAELRTRLHAGGLSRSPGRAFGPGTSAEELARAVGFPAVIRDSAGIAGRDGWLARGPADLDAIWSAAAAGEMLGDVLTAEPCFEGPVYAVEVLVWAGRTQVRSVASRAGAGEFPAGRLLQLTRWLSQVMRCIEFQCGFAGVDVAITERGLEALSVDIRTGDREHGEELCRALEAGATAVFGEVVLDRDPTRVAPSPSAGRALFYAGDPGVFDIPARNPPDVSGRSGCVAVLLASGPRAESTLLTAMTSPLPASTPYRRPGGHQRRPAAQASSFG